MFDKKTQAEALILADEGPAGSTDTDIHGVHWDHHKYIVEVRPTGQDPFRVETKTKVAIGSSPGTGDLVKVGYDPKSHKTEIQIEGDPGYDPKLVREAKKQQRAARTQALLAGAPVAETARAVHFVNVVDDEPRWTVPAICPQCGARVDQSTASMAGHPRCEYCAKPLPCEPVRYEQDLLSRVRPSADSLLRPSPARRSRSRAS